ncbi:MAG: hypothetical protein IT448_02180 [Phycisphaerales bacterium]|nr:hypothetical protein [Phycisphaerales bacterium]
MAKNQSNRQSSQLSALQGRQIIVGVCGGIAAYKVADVVSNLVQAGAGVTVCMSAQAKQFVTPLTFQTLSGQPVRDDLFNLTDASDPQHIALTEQADLLLVAPATAHLIAKVAHGLCDDIISLMICAAACPVLFAPAMNNRMWANPVTQENVAKLQALGYPFVGPESGFLACRNIGPGRLSETAQIIEKITQLLHDPAKSTTRSKSK